VSAAAPLQSWLADTVAMVLFCTVTGAAVEVGISGLSWEQSLQARLAAVPLNLLSARPYGWYRDWVLAALGALEGGALRKALLDVAAFVTFQVPVYATVLVFTGATCGQIVTSCATLACLSAFLGRPYGAFLEWCRRVASSN
jgi:hypothetical protein